MMKRMLILLLVLLTTLTLPAMAEEGVGDKISNALFKIVLRTEEGDQTLGSAVLFMDRTILLTAEACCAEGDLFAVDINGAEYAVGAWEKTDNTSIALMELVTPVPAEPLTFARNDTQTLPYLFGVNEEGKMGSVNLTQARKTIYRDMTAVIFTAQEGLMPGAFAADVNGGITGLVVAQQTEGMGLYIAYDPDIIYDVLMETSSVDQFLDVELNWDNGYLIAKWEDEPRTGGGYCVTLSCEENVYYTIFETEAEDRSIEFIVPPGRNYHVQVQWVEDGKEPLEPVWAAMTTLMVREDLFMDYNFSQECWIGLGLAGQESVSLLPRLEKVTTGELSDPSNEMYMKINCKYSIAKETELPMAVEMIAPDGQFYFTALTCWFNPQKQENDYFSFSIQELLDDCATFSEGVLQPGEYTLSYYISGCYAGEYTFTIQEGESEGQIVKSGFVSNLTIHQDPGCLTVTWPDFQLPEGAKLSVYSLVEGNNFYTYQNMQEGETQAMFFTVPGRYIMVWAEWYTDESARRHVPESQNECQVIRAVPESRFNGFGFVNHHMSVVPSTDASAGERTELLPAAPITREVLNDPGTILYFQTHDTYEVSETSDNHPLSVVLCTPEGMCFAQYGYFIFDASLQAGDIWLMDMTEVLDSYRRMVGSEVWPAGEYRILYCIDGQIAAEYTFTLE